MTYPLVVVLGVLVQPHFAQPYAVPLEHVHAATPLVRRTFPEDVAHVWARHDFQGAWNQPPVEFHRDRRRRKRLIAVETSLFSREKRSAARFGCTSLSLSLLEDFIDAAGFRAKIFREMKRGKSRWDIERRLQVYSGRISCYVDWMARLPSPVIIMQRKLEHFEIFFFLLLSFF